MEHARGAPSSPELRTYGGDDVVFEACNRPSLRDGTGLAYAALVNGTYRSRVQKIQEAATSKTLTRGGVPQLPSPTFQREQR